MSDHTNPHGKTAPAGFTATQIAAEPGVIQYYEGPDVVGAGIDVVALWQPEEGGVRILMDDTYMTVTDFDELLEELQQFRAAVLAAQAEHETLNGSK